jgi:tetratricopeptide (TPR) repeat protein
MIFARKLHFSISGDAGTGSRGSNLIPEGTRHGNLPLGNGMNELDQLKRIIQRSHELSKSGRAEEALALLDYSLSQAIREKREMWIRLLSRHAAVISDLMGDLQRVRHYYQQSLASDPNDVAALYGLAEALHRHGETELAKQYAFKCYHAVQQGQDEAHRALVEMILAVWPDLNDADGAPSGSGD